MFSEKKKTEKR